VSVQKDIAEIAYRDLIRSRMKRRMEKCNSMGDGKIEFNFFYGLWLLFLISLDIIRLVGFVQFLSRIDRS